jgi:hypothetical protein
VVQSPPNRNCGGSNRGPPYQVQRQSPLKQLTISTIYLTLAPQIKVIELMDILLID